MVMIIDSRSLGAIGASCNVQLINGASNLGVEPGMQDEGKLVESN